MHESFRPKLKLNRYPTPFHELIHLRSFVHSKPRIFIKRDDLTDIGLGGNKNRKLDYVLAEALRQGADTIITVGGKQSNHCRQTLSYAKALGLDCHLVLEGIDDVPHQGNHFVFDILGAHLHYEPDEDISFEACEKLARELSEKGKNPYVIPSGASTPLGTLGYIDCVDEIADQLKAEGISGGHIFVPSGSAGTQAGSMIGAKLYLPEAKVHGLTVSRKSREQAPKVLALANDTAAFIGQDFRFDGEDILLHDEYYGAGYAIPSPAGNKAIRLVGEQEGILLDPVYTGKAMSGLLDLLAKGEFDDSEAVVFIHTGGSPAIYDFTDTF